MSLSLAGVAALLGPIGKILEKVIPDPNEANRIKSELTKAMLSADGEFYKAAGGIITTEASGESWMQRNWRPITMLTFVFIIANNYILAPYAQFIAGWFGYSMLIPVLEIPNGMWSLLQIGIGGYIASRGVEKVTASVQAGGVPLIGSRERAASTTSQADLVAALRDAGRMD